MINVPITSCILVQVVRDVRATGLALMAASKVARVSNLKTIMKNICFDKSLE